MFGIGDTELLLIIVFAFLLFGPDKLPTMGRTIGRGLRQFRQASDSVTKVVQSEVLDPMKQAASENASAMKAKHDIADEDADLDIESVQAAHKETFAERKARLAAEKAAKQAAEKADAAEATAAAADAVASGAPVEAASAVAAAEATAAVAATAPVAEEEPAPEVDRKSAAALYGLAPQAKPASTQTSGEEDGPAGA